MPRIGTLQEECHEGWDVMLDHANEYNTFEPVPNQRANQCGCAADVV